MKSLLFAVLGLLALSPVEAQNYQALHGSPYSGSLSNDFNPAAILNSPYDWDLTVLGVQAKIITNAFNVSNASLLHTSDTLLINTHTGNYARYALVSADIHLFNARISLSRRTAIAFGLNMRNYARLIAGPYNYTDTTTRTLNFLSINEPNTPLSGNGAQASWLEGYATYSHVIFEDDGARLQAGITLDLLRSLSGAYAIMKNGTYIPEGAGYQVTNVAAQYGYSTNYDNFYDKEKLLEKFKKAIKEGEMGGSFSVGGEYVQKTGDDWGREEKAGTDEYAWKLGVALMDVGVNRYHYGLYSAAFSGVKGNVTDTTLDNRFDNITALKAFNDSVKSRVDQYTTPFGLFNIATPARLMINFDKRLPGYWAVNGEFTYNFTGINSTYASVNELNLITVTPRWEKSEIGAYLPLEVTNQGHFWVGAAIKAGPLLLGLHNLAWLVSQKAMPNGGAYLAIIIHPGVHQKDGLPCPKY